MTEHKYSVLMSIYYKEKPEFLIESIDSMLNQTVKPDEIVLVKDGKLTTDLEMVIKNYVDLEPDLFVIVPLEKNLGLGLALNEGLKKCKNELIARMDTDDISLNNRCELQLNEFSVNPNLGIVGCWTDEFYDISSNIITSRIVPETHEKIMKFSRRRSPFNHPTVMYKKSVVLKSGGYRDVLRKEDIDLFVRMLHNGCLAKNIPKTLLLFRSNKDNYKKRKTWVNCKSYIKVINNFRKQGYSSWIDLIVVTISQIMMFLMPVWLMRKISDKYLRKKV